MRVLQSLEYSYRNDEWRPPAAAATHLSSLAQADALHAALMLWADALAGCIERSHEEAEFRVVIDAIEPYEAIRWPLGKDPAVPSGKG